MEETGLTVLDQKEETKYPTCKQYIQKYFPGMNWDFDLDVEFNNLKPGESKELQCIGYGFTHILVDPKGQKMAVYNNGTVYVPYEQLDEFFVQNPLNV